jgi:hypothetical protein
MSCILQNAFCSASSSVEITMPSLLHSKYLMVFDDEHGSVMWPFPWIVGLCHFVHTRNAKHCAMLQKIKRFYDGKGTTLIPNA